MWRGSFKAFCVFVLLSILFFNAVNVLSFLFLKNAVKMTNVLLKIRFSRDRYSKRGPMWIITVTLLSLPWSVFEKLC